MVLENFPNLQIDSVEVISQERPRNIPKKFYEAIKIELQTHLPGLITDSILKQSKIFDDDELRDNVLRIFASDSTQYNQDNHASWVSDVRNNAEALMEYVRKSTDDPTKVDSRVQFAQLFYWFRAANVEIWDYLRKVEKANPNI